MKNFSTLKALEIKYIQLLRVHLVAIGGWENMMHSRPRQLTLLNVRVFLIAIQFIVVIGEINFLYQNFGKVEFYLLGDVYISSFLTIQSLTRLCLVNFKSYNTLCKTFVTEFHLVYFEHKGVIFKEISALFDKISYYFTIFMTGMLVGGTALFNLSPLYVNYMNGVFTSNRHNLDNITLVFSVNYQYPGYSQTKMFFLSTLINFFLSFVCSISIVSIDLLLIVMVFQIIGHLKILSKNMRSIMTPKKTHLLKEIGNKSLIIYEVEMFDDDENCTVKQILKDLVDHHRRIISFTDNITNVFGPILGFNYMFHLVSCCVLLLECSRGDPDVVVRYGPVTVVVFMQLIQISVLFELLGSKSEELKDCAYEMPWQCMSVENQRIVSIMLCRMQRPIQVTAYGVAAVGVQTMASILKTTFSYFTVLRTME